MTEVAPQVQVPVVGNTITRQARRLYVGNIPFGVSDVRAAEVCKDYVKYGTVLNFHVQL